MDPFKSSERTTVESTAEIPAEGLPDEILKEIERLEFEDFNNTGDSLHLSHDACYNVYNMNETLAGFGRDLQILELGAGLVNKTSSDSDKHISKPHLTRVSADFVEEIIPTGNHCSARENSKGLGDEFDIILNNLKEQQDMILKTNSNLKNHVKQEHEMIFGLHKTNLEPYGQVTQQHEIISELRKQLNTLPQDMTKINQERASDCSDQPQIEIAEGETVTTIERPLTTHCGQTDQLQDIECVQSSTENEVETQSHSKEVVQSEHVAPSLQEVNFNQSNGSLKTKQARSGQIREGHGKRIKFNLESVEESPKNSRKPRQESKSYTCGVCNKQYNHKNSLVVHLRTHTGEKPYVCKFCDLAFCGSGNLASHQRTHTGEKPYKCEVCNDAFSSSKGLKKHQRTHTGEKPYVCKNCGTAFAAVGDLRRHERTHTGEKPYVCKDCGKAFTAVGNLRRHQKTHMDEKPFFCDICKKSFGRKFELSRHMDIHSGNKPHKCNECQKKFSRRCSLKKHIQTHSKKRF